MIFNGSPRKNGDTACLIQEMKSVLSGEIKEVSAYYDGISPCVDCRHCWKEDGCAILDGMQDVYRAMTDFDNIIVTSPVYFSQLSGPLISLASRFQCLYMAKRFRGVPYGGKLKHGALILTGGGDGSFEPAGEMAHRFFRYANAGCIGEVMSLKTDDVPACRDESAKARARELALELNRLNGCGELRPLSVSDGQDVYDMLQEIPYDENGFINGMHGKNADEFKQWLAHADGVAKGFGLEDWQVPQSTFWLYVDGQPVGYGKVRHRLTEKLLVEGGHIGYGVRPSRRGRGYGTLLLKLLLEEAWKLNISKVLLTIQEGNAPSLGVALGNGGIIEKTENGKHYVWIGHN